MSGWTKQNKEKKKKKENNNKKEIQNQNHNPTLNHTSPLISNG